SHLWEGKIKKDIDRKGGGKAEYVGKAYVPGYRMVCNKKSEDGSGKGNIEEDPNSSVHGILFLLDVRGLSSLEDSEKGYVPRKDIDVLSDGRKVDGVTVFKAKKGNTCTSLKPYIWYKEMVVEGARHRDFPPDYFSFLEAIDAYEDPDNGREIRKRKEYGLK
ncbi:MAG: hypothetical protein V3W11_02270, partial [bacterium]